MDYPVTLERDDEGRVVVTFPDFPGARAVGEYEADALHQARAALVSAAAACVAERQPIPAPSRRAGLPRVAMPALVEAKLHVYEAMREEHIGRAELARRLRWHRPQVDRLLNLRHASRLDQLEAALALFGKQLRLTVVDASAATEMKAGKR